MKFSWKEEKLGSLVKFSSGGTPNKNNPSYWNGSIPWISAKNMKSEVIGTSDLTITEEGLIHGSKIAPKGSLLLLVRGSGLFNGIPVCYLENAVAYNQDVKCIESTSELENKYLFYWLKANSSYLRKKLEFTSIGAGKFDTRFLSNLVVRFPDKATRKRIIDIADNISDRININKKINENLEQQALALFRHYFMDYEPYGGAAPSSWTEVSLDDACVRITDGSHYSPADAPDAPYPMYSVKDMETYGFNSSSCKHITAEEFLKMRKNDCVPRLNDILVAKDGSYLKEIFICSEEKDEAILSSIAIFRPNTEVIIPEVLLYLLKQPSVRKDVGDNYVSGSALPRIVLKDFKKYSFLLPPMTEQLRIGSILHAIRMQTKANVDEIQNLSVLRDTLLPRLMSGELDVSELEL